MMFILILIGILGWLFVRKNLPNNYQKPALIILIGILIFLPILFPSFVDQKWAYNNIWPVAGGILIGEFLLKWWTKIKAINQRFIHSNKHNSSQTKNNQK